MEEKDDLNVILCGKFDARTLIENNRTSAFESHLAACCECGGKVIITGASKRMIEEKPRTKPLCFECAEKLGVFNENTKLFTTRGHLNEIISYLVKESAAKN